PPAIARARLGLRLRGRWQRGGRFRGLFTAQAGGGRRAANHPHGPWRRIRLETVSQALDKLGLRRPLSIRARVTIAATAAVALVLIGGGILTVATFAQRERSSFDRELERGRDGPGGST